MGVFLFVMYNRSVDVNLVKFVVPEVDSEDVRFMAKQLLADSIWKEANIELVNPITFPDTLSLLEDATPRGLDLDTILVVKNLRDAWKVMLNEIDNELLNIDYIKELNYQIGAGLYRPAGELRKSAVFVRGSNYQPPTPTIDQVNSTVYNLSEIENPIDQALSAFCALAREQWFIDGNKRTAQVFANSLLIKNNCGILSIAPEDKPEFFSLLIDFYDTNRPNELKNFLYTKCFTVARKSF